MLLAAKAGTNVNARSRFAVGSLRNSRRGTFVVSQDELKQKAEENTISASDGGDNLTVVTKDRARHGVTGHNVRYVLGFGLAASIVVFAVVYFAYFG